jgi:Pyruvate/2-oxoacid:ferredoxin oxidoreductase delta subunit
VADVLTLTFLGLVVFFAMRRIILPEINAVSSRSDYLLLTITGAPFLTGFFSTHGVLDTLPVLGANMQVIHELSGEAMLITAAVLFCRPRIYEDKCIGCAACELSCPTGTLETIDRSIFRIFNYSHYQCICCGNCAKTCPEDAAELRHELSGRRVFQVVSKYRIHSVELKECEQCGARFAPEPQLDKIRSLPEFEKVQKVMDEHQMRICPQCRRTNHANVLVRAAPKSSPG